MRQANLHQHGDALWTLENKSGSELRNLEDQPGCSLAHARRLSIVPHVEDCLVGWLKFASQGLWTWALHDRAKCQHADVVVLPGHAVELRAGEVNGLLDDSIAEETGHFEQQ